jgi:hypothetical protein
MRLTQFPGKHLQRVKADANVLPETVLPSSGTSYACKGAGELPSMSCGLVVPLATLDRLRALRGSLDHVWPFDPFFHFRLLEASAT